MKIIDFEKSMNKILPPVYKSFVQTFDCTNINREELLCYYNEEYSTTVQFYSANFELDSHVNLESFFDVLKINSINSAVYGEDNFAEKNELLPIGECNDQGILLVGYGVSNQDVIYIEYPHADPRLIKVSENIIDFFQSYTIEIVEGYLPKGKSSSDLYKNWGEDFWRVRKD